MSQTHIEFQCTPQSIVQELYHEDITNMVETRCFAYSLLKYGLRETHRPDKQTPMSYDEVKTMLLKAHIPPESLLSFLVPDDILDDRRVEVFGGQKMTVKELRESHFADEERLIRPTFSDPTALLQLVHEVATIQYDEVKDLDPRSDMRISLKQGSLKRLLRLIQPATSDPTLNRK